MLCKVHRKISVETYYIYERQLRPLQKQIFEHLLSSKAVRDTVKGNRTDVLPLIGTLRKLVNHPYLVYEALKTSKGDNDT